MMTKNITERTETRQPFETETEIEQTGTGGF